MGAMVLMWRTSSLDEFSAAAAIQFLANLVRFPPLPRPKLHVHFPASLCFSTSKPCWAHFQAESGSFLCSSHLASGPAGWERLAQFPFSTSACRISLRLVGPASSAVLSFGHQGQPAMSKDLQRRHG